MKKILRFTSFCVTITINIYIPFYKIFYNYKVKSKYSNYIQLQLLYRQKYISVSIILPTFAFSYQT